MNDKEICLLIFVPIFYSAIGAFAWGAASDTDEYDRHMNVTIGVFWPLVLSYILLKYFFILIYTIFKSLYLSFLDIPLLKTLKNKIRERSMKPLNSYDYKNNRFD